MDIIFEGVTAVLGLIGLGLGVLSERRARAAKATAKRDACYRTIIEHAGEGILVADAATGSSCVPPMNWR